MNGYCDSCFEKDAKDIRVIEFRKVFGRCHRAMGSPTIGWYRPESFCKDCRKIAFGLWRYYKREVR
jgi:hypothetical protein